MNGFFEIDFLDVESEKSGDAITLRYQSNTGINIHVVDGGFQDTGTSIVNHVKNYYNNPRYIDRVVVSHPDGDHSGGLRTVLQKFEIRELWMLRPWLYADEIIHRFSRFSSVTNLEKRLKEIYSNIAVLEEIAIERRIPIYEPFQGAMIGEFMVLAPSKERYLDLIVESERTPESTENTKGSNLDVLLGLLEKAGTKIVSLIRAAWGEEIFSPEETSAENEMSVVQFASLCGKRILLTADAGRTALFEAANYAQFAGIALPGIDYFQVPHHGSRRNVSTELLDRWLGPRLPDRSTETNRKFYAIISSAKKDEDHPRKAVVRACIHRGADVYTTEGKTLCISHNVPLRQGWSIAQNLPYPDEQEE